MYIEMAFRFMWENVTYEEWIFLQILVQFFNPLDLAVLGYSWRPFRSWIGSLGMDFSMTGRFASDDILHLRIQWKL